MNIYTKDWMSYIQGILYFSLLGLAVENKAFLIE